MSNEDKKATSIIIPIITETKTFIHSFHLALLSNTYHLQESFCAYIYPNKER